MKKLNKAEIASIAGGSFIWLLIIVGALNPAPSPTTQPDQASQTSEPQQTEVLNAVDIKEEEVKQPKKEVKTETKTEAVPFTTEKTFSDEYANGTTHVLVNGKNGRREITYKVTYIDGKEESRVKVSDVISLQPVAQVVVHGTYVQSVAEISNTPSGNCDPNYSPCVPYSASDLDCPDIGFSVTVVGSDLHRLDADNDGLGCESY